MSSSDRGSEWILIAGGFRFYVLVLGEFRIKGLVGLFGYLAISYRLTGGQPAAGGGGGARASYPGTL